MMGGKGGKAREGEKGGTGIHYPAVGAGVLVLWLLGKGARVRGGWVG